MLLTSAQVSVAISSFIVFIFTTALFLSGYVLQQQTVRDLRAAIKPQLVRPPPGPDLYLPPQFRDDAYWEARGVVDAVLGDIEKEKLEKKKLDNVGQGLDSSDDMVGATRWQKAARKKQQTQSKEGQKPMTLSEDSSKRNDAEDNPTESEEKPMSRAERRKKIKEQILAEGEGEGFKGYKRRMW